MITFLNFNFLLFFILFFPLSYLVSSKYKFLFFFFFFPLCFSPPHTYTPFISSTRIYFIIFNLSSLAFLFFYFNSVFLSLSLYLHCRPHNSHIGKHCKQNTPENFLNCNQNAHRSENTSPLPLPQTQAHCPQQIEKQKHKPTLALGMR